MEVILILMRTTTSVSAIRWQNPILSIVSADKGGALDVSGQWEICVLKFSDVLLLTISCSKLFQSMVAWEKKNIYRQQFL